MKFARLAGVSEGAKPHLAAMDTTIRQLRRRMDTIQKSVDMAARALLEAEAQGPESLTYVGMAAAEYEFLRGQLATQASAALQAGVTDVNTRALLGRYV